MDEYVVKIYVHTDERDISFLVIVLLQVKYEMVDVKTSNHWYTIPGGVSCVRVKTVSEGEEINKYKLHSSRSKVQLSQHSNSTEAQRKHLQIPDAINC
jgi:hypothetical protein